MRRLPPDVRRSTGAFVLGGIFAAALSTGPADAGEAQLVISDSQMGAAFLKALAKSSLVLDNYGKKHGNSWLDQQSRLRLPDGRTVSLTVPEVSATVGGVRQWRYYVDDLRSRSISVSPDKKDHSRFLVRMPFEDSGHEIKGRCLRRKLNGSWKECSLKIERDIQINNPRARLVLRPAVVDGRIGYKVLDAAFAGHLQPANVLCKLAPGVCSAVTVWHQTALTALVGSTLRAEFSRAKTRKAVASMVQKQLDPDLSHRLESMLGFRPKHFTVSGIDRVKYGWRVTLQYEAPPPRQQVPKSAKVAAAVTKVETTVSPTRFRGRCPATLKVSGFVTTSRPTTVSFRFVNDRGERSTTTTWKFVEAGRHQLSTWQPSVAPAPKHLAAKGGAGGPQVLAGWYRVEILAPRPIKGPVKSFRVECVKTKTMQLAPLKPR